MPKVFKSQLVENILPGTVASPGATTKLQFQDQPYLREKHIYGIECIILQDMQLSPTGNVPLTAAQMETAYLTLYLNDVNQPNSVGEWIQNVPFTLLHRVQNGNTDSFVRQMYELVGQVIYWEKCYVTFPVALGNTAPVSVLLNVYFK